MGHLTHKNEPLDQFTGSTIALTLQGATAIATGRLLPAPRRRSDEKVKPSMMISIPRIGRALLALLAAAALAAGPLALVGTKPAEAAFPGGNGKIVFVSERTIGTGVDNPEGDEEIFTMNPDGSGLTQLTKNAARDSWPAWSADGTQIAFATDRD